MNTNLIHGDMTIELPKLPSDHFDSCVTDPPYELGFMGKAATLEGFGFTDIELNDTPEHPYFTIAKSRIVTQ